MYFPDFTGASWVSRVWHIWDRLHENWGDKSLQELMSLNLMVNLNVHVKNESSTRGRRKQMAKAKNQKSPRHLSWIQYISGSSMDFCLNASHDLLEICSEQSDMGSFFISYHFHATPCFKFPANPIKICRFFHFMLVFIHIHIWNGWSYLWYYHLW